MNEIKPWLGNAKATAGILKKYGIHTKKKYGQNFLIDERVLEKIIEAAGITKDDFVLEIGPGIGTLTQYLGAAAGEVLAVEVDKSLLPVLEETLSGFDNVTVLYADILKTDLQKIAEEKNGGRPIRIVANLPYYITTPIIMGILESRAPVSSQTFMVQKEVAERMAAAPGGKEYGALSLAVQYYCTTELNANVPPNCFIPRPDVQSTVITLTTRREKTAVADEELLFRVIRAAFAMRRKTLVNCLKSSQDLNLSRAEAEKLLADTGLEQNIRGEALSLEDFVRLTDRLAAR
ncbi:MAG: 16S rRNA (adenine(1518)-N(6)/adenine(1519)-N(6))-dimethyltransferase RsmA [Lachnospiraceae bacterium]|nr:16S rRNA (adenine(1518)-N(6)/adenine(1519)-N(6))-dimethyltransferase RsmA [Lachnospiraceae bacterium]